MIEEIKKITSKENYIKLFFESVFISYFLSFGYYFYFFIKNINDATYFEYLHIIVFIIYIFSPFIFFYLYKKPKDIFEKIGKIVYTILGLFIILWTIYSSISLQEKIQKENIENIIKIELNKTETNILEKINYTENKINENLNITFIKHGNKSDGSFKKLNDKIESLEKSISKLDKK